MTAKKTATLYNHSDKKAVHLGSDYQPVKPGMSCEVDLDTAKALKGHKLLKDKPPKE